MSQNTDKLPNLDAAPSLAEIFGEPISVYTRATAIADGVLVDVTDTAEARECGLRFPVALTDTLHADLCDIPERLVGVASYAGRLYDLLRMHVYHVNGVVEPLDRYRHECGETMLFRFVMTVAGNEGCAPVGEIEGDWYVVKATVGPGDDGEPVLTFMRENED